MSLIFVVIWVVLMMFWLFGGGYANYHGNNSVFNPVLYGGYVLVPWLCVLILGLFVFGAFGAPVIPSR